MDIFLPVGERLKEERLRLRINQDDFSQEAGITRKTLFGYETGARTPDAGSLSIWAKMGLDVAYVVTGERKQPPSVVLSAEEQVIVDAYRKLPEENKKQLMVLALTGIDISEKKAKKKKDKAVIDVSVGDNSNNSGNVNSNNNVSVGNNSVNVGDVAGGRIIKGK